jgi:hypothetical protein
VAWGRDTLALVTAMTDLETLLLTSGRLILTV